MDKNTLEKMATTAFKNLDEARTSLFDAAESAITTRNALDEARYNAMTGGVIDGKNAEIREAQMKSHLQADFLKLEQAEKSERRKRFMFDLAQIEVDTVKTLLRIAELA